MKRQCKGNYKMAIQRLDINTICVGEAFQLKLLLNTSKNHGDPP
jgi:hypothetical protein